MKSRYDRNQELYKKVRDNDYEEYNQNVKDIELDFDRKVNRKEFHEKKRLSVYFSDIDQELETANTKLNTLSEEPALEIKKNVDLKSLIEQAKKNHRSQGGNIFSNTQYEILSSLNVDEDNDVIDSDDVNLDLELADIIGQTVELNLENELIIEDGFDNNTIVDLKVINGFNLDKVEENEADEDIEDIEEVEDIEDTEEIEDVEEIESIEDIEDAFETSDSNEVEKDEVLEEIEDIEDDFFSDFEEDQKEEPLEKSKKSKKSKKDKKEKQSKEDELELKEKNEKMLTIILVFLIVSLLVVGAIFASQYIGG